MSITHWWWVSAAGGLAAAFTAAGSPVLAENLAI
jgi:hypothetical protein